MTAKSRTDLPSTLSFILISSSASLAHRALSNGVGRVMVDLEVLGKMERQGHRDTLISSHTLADVAAMAAAVDPARIIVRSNPLHTDLQGELDAIVRHKPGFVMMPMVRSAAEVQQYAALLEGRAALIVLVETAAGLEDIEAIAALPDVAEVYLGLNDLHLDMQLRFMFQPLAMGLVDKAAAATHAAGKPFGFGGIARLDEGAIAGKTVLAEHVRLRSTSVILSRTFHRREANNDSLADDNEFFREIERLHAARETLQQASSETLQNVHRDLVRIVDEIVQNNEATV